MITITGNVALIRCSDLKSLEESIRECIAKAANDGIPLLSSSISTVLANGFLIDTVLLTFQHVIEKPNT